MLYSRKNEQLAIRLVEFCRFKLRICEFTEKIDDKIPIYSIAYLLTGNINQDNASPL